jgi:hypothetical protein
MAQPLSSLAVIHISSIREYLQVNRSPPWGGRGRKFESCRSDQCKPLSVLVLAGANYWHNSRRPHEKHPARWTMARHRTARPLPRLHDLEPESPWQHPSTQPVGEVDIVLMAKPTTVDYLTKQPRWKGYARSACLPMLAAMLILGLAAAPAGEANGPLLTDQEGHDVDAVLDQAIAMGFPEVRSARWHEPATGYYRIADLELVGGGWLPVLVSNEMRS